MHEKNTEHGKFDSLHPAEAFECPKRATKDKRRLWQYIAKTMPHHSHKVSST